MYNPHQELLDKLHTLNAKIEALDDTIKQQVISIKTTSTEEDILYTPKQLAQKLQICVQTVHNKRKAGIWPYEQNGRIVRFSKQAIDKISKLK